MRSKVRHIVLAAVFCLFGLLAYAQTSQHPPEPRMSTSTAQEGPIPCNEGNGLPPPTGLCVPINDYVYPLLIVGILLGAYKIHKIESGKKVI